MTQQWILAAEADKIQDLVFRSSHLREVVGGSQLLTRFCAEGARKLQNGQDPPQVVVADGGSFTLLFNSEQAAREYGQSLAQLYREVTGSTMTVAEPVEWSGEDKDFPDANKRSRLGLARAKREGREPVAVEQMPYMAFCASCGIGLAYTHRLLHDKADKANYLCPACRNKAEERKNEGTAFLLKFKEAVLGDCAAQFHWPSEADDLAGDWEARNYVAYLVADGNGMGKLFGKCSSVKQLHNLSLTLTNVLRQSLAEPTKMLMARAPASKHYQSPVLPLILGGDDVFVLLPACYALDFARRFCLEYEERMKTELQKPEIGITGVKPTMSVAVVICKAKYPHTLAHKHGEELLKSAKRLTKQVACEEGKPEAARSIVNFDVILGSRIARQEKPSSFHPTLRPYWVIDEDVGCDELDKYPDVTWPPAQIASFSVGLPLNRLIRQRYRLRHVPTRRLAQLRELYITQLPNDNDAGLWQARRVKLLGRIANRDPSQGKSLDAAIQELGDPEHWLQWYLANRPGARFTGHGLPDLLELWDFCWCLDRPRSEYLAREE